MIVWQIVSIILWLLVSEIFYFFIVKSSTREEVVEGWLSLKFICLVFSAIITFGFLAVIHYLSTVTSEELIFSLKEGVVFVGYGTLGVIAILICIYYLYLNKKFAYWLKPIKKTRKKKNVKSNT